METTTYRVLDTKTNAHIGGTYTWAQRNRCRNRTEKLNQEYGAHRYVADPKFN